MAIRFAPATQDAAKKMNTVKKRPTKREIGKLKESIEKVPRTEPLPIVTRDTPSAAKKLAVSIRLDLDIIVGFKAQGPGWQTKVNDALRNHLGLK